MLTRAFAVLSLSAIAASFVAVAGMAGVWLGIQWPRLAQDPCGLPAGITLNALPDAERAYALRHALVCDDLYHGRITPVEFRERLATLDASKPFAPVLPLVTEVWAATVRDVSTQYTAASWSARRVLGAPDVFPTHGDHQDAWAPLLADGGLEQIEVGFETAHRVRAVDVVETLNPGAVTRVEIATANGEWRSVYQGQPSTLPPRALRRRVEFQCTSEPVVAVRVTLDTKAVAGWNEIDAIGVVPCS